MLPTGDKPETDIFAKSTQKPISTLHGRVLSANVPLSWSQDLAMSEHYGMQGNLSYFGGPFEAYSPIRSNQHVEEHVHHSALLNHHSSGRFFSSRPNESFADSISFSQKFDRVRARSINILLNHRHDMTKGTERQDAFEDGSIFLPSSLINPDIDFPSFVHARKGSLSNESSTRSSTVSSVVCEIALDLPIVKEMQKSKLKVDGKCLTRFFFDSFTREARDIVIFLASRPEDGQRQAMLLQILQESINPIFPGI